MFQRTSSPSPRSRKRWIGCLVGLAVVIGIFAVIAGSIAGAVVGSRDATWPLVLKVAQQLQTQEGTHDLWQRNPGLATTWDSEAAFQEMAKTHREALRSLPQQPPKGHTLTCWIGSDPERIRAFIKLNGGSWFHVHANLQSSEAVGLFGLQVEPPSGFDQQFKVMRQLTTRSRRGHVVSILQALQSDPSQHLMQASGLPAPQVQPWLEDVKAHGALIAALLKDLESGEARIRRNSGQMLWYRNTRISAIRPDGSGIRLEYTQDRLSSLSFLAPDPEDVPEPPEPPEEIHIE